MAAYKRTEHQSEQDALYITDLFVRNYSLRQIAEKINQRAAKDGLGYAITFQQVHYDIKKILGVWKDERDDMIDGYVNLELAKLDKIENECWEAWEKSKTGKLKTRIENGTLIEGRMTGGNIKDRTIETGYGDVRFLDRIQACIDKRIEILGLAKPKKISIVNSDESIPLPENEEEVLADMNRLLKELNIIGSVN